MPHHRRQVGSLLVALALSAAVCSHARADQIRIGDENFVRARITGLKDGQLQFRTFSREARSVWLSDIDMLIVDTVGGFADFNDAERFLAAGEPGKSLVRYQRALRGRDDFWGEVMSARLCIAADRAGRISDAVLNFIRVVRGSSSGIPAAARLIPVNVDASKAAEVRRALDHLDAALDRVRSADQAALFRLARFEILRTTDNSAALAEAYVVGRLEVPQDARTDRVYRIKYAALDRALRERVTKDDLEGMDRAIAECPEAILPDFLLLKGQALLRSATEEKQIVRAAWALMRVAIHMPDDPRAAAALYHAALAMERLGRPGKAADLLAECLGHDRILKEDRDRCEAAQRRIKAGGPPLPRI